MDEYLPAVARSRTTLSAHCNGLLLLNIEAPGDHVVNPATRAWAPVPPPPAFGDDVPDIFEYYQSYLVFDPTLSPYYEDSGPWVLHDVNYNFNREFFLDNIKEAITEEKYEWDSDNDNVLGNEDRSERHRCGDISILGFHPFKEVIFLSQSEERGLAYHWNSTNVQDLGNICPTEYEYFAMIWTARIDVCFPYTPCWT
ncbi:hypothetical protein BAE44_0002806 [Dichanthelium oligosanthes]|uniref:Uncharacterized protein n=1 Tax=Dichanthelium oligosanthes TaxID=888268 RepID=A0A1E5WFQ3_9POAL|nr:hypothetical protein BAE44_0002806 [Dichanthelium oligosanthes]